MDCGKNTYSRKEAGTLVNLAKGRHNRGNKTRKIPVRYYWCESCGGFHLTSKKENYRAKK